MAELSDFSDIGGAVGDTYADEQGTWTIISVYDASAGRYNWGLTDPLTTGTGTVSATTAQLLANRINTIEQALGPDTLTDSIDYQTLFENKLL